MAHTSHGHHIPGTTGADFKPTFVARCGGIKMCSRCIQEAKSSMSNRTRVISMGISNPGTETDPVNPIEKAEHLVRQHVDSYYLNETEDKAPENYTVYVYFFCYILGGWKAEASTSIPDGKVYELTYNVAKKETYLDEYVKVCNVVIQDL